MSTSSSGAVIGQEASIFYLSIDYTGIILSSIISITDLSATLCLFMVFTGSCMTKFDLPANYH
jgi:hypothetical protein